MILFNCKIGYRILNLFKKNKSSISLSCFFSFCCWSFSSFSVYQPKHSFQIIHTLNDMKQSSPKYISGKPYQIRTSTFDNFKGLLYALYDDLCSGWPKYDLSFFRDRITFLNLEQQYLIWGVGLILFSAIFFVGFMYVMDRIR